MAVERLKFRCYQCNQLLASAPGKAGSIVACPRCKADLVVPAADSPAAAEPDATAVGRASGRAPSTLAPAKRSVAGGVDDDAAAMPADLIDLRPEDLRVEAEFFQSLTHAPERQNQPEAAPWGAAEAAVRFPTCRDQHSRGTAFRVPRDRDRGPSVPASRSPFGISQRVPSLAPSAPLLAPASPVVPPIEIEPPSLLPPNREFRPVREVVLPASAVLAWSLFGLIGIATSFLAGLMVGHYFWRM